MATQIVVPPLGESVTEATIARWSKKAGDAVKVDELLVELETDKVTLEVNSPANGILSQILVPEGATVSVGTALGNITEGGVASQTKEVPAEMPLSAAKQQSILSTEAEKIFSPAASKIAADRGINTALLQGTGKDGRITKGDVIEVSSTAITDSTYTSILREKRVKISRLRKTIAERLKESQNTAAILTTFNEIDMGEAMRIRKAYQDQFVEKYGIKLGFMSFFVKATVEALKEIPAVNAEIDNDELVYKNYYDIGIAVGTEQGLVVPVLRDADKLSFSEIEKGIATLGKKARDGKLTMSDMSGATFSITNGGIYGSMMSTPIINPPQSGILGMHNIVERPMAVNGQVEIRPMMYVALSYDHRIIDGKEAVTFLVRLKQIIEKPEKLLFGL